MEKEEGDRGSKKDKAAKRRSASRHKKQPTGEAPLKKKSKKHRPESMAEVPIDISAITSSSPPISHPIAVAQSSAAQNPDAVEDRNRVEEMVDTVVQRVRTVLRRKSANDDDDDPQFEVSVDKFKTGFGRDVRRRRSHSFNQADLLRTLDIEISESEELRKFTSALNSRLTRNLSLPHPNEEAFEMTGTDRATYSVAMRSDSESSDELFSLHPSKNLSSPPSLQEMSPLSRSVRNGLSFPHHYHAKENSLGNQEIPQDHSNRSFDDIASDTGSVQNVHELQFKDLDGKETDLESNDNDNVSTGSSRDQNRVQKEGLPLVFNQLNRNNHIVSSKDKRIRLNVGGKRFETYASTLASYPDTLLGAMFNPRNQLLRSAEESSTPEEYFFDRDPECFEIILNFYRTGSIIVPQHVPLELLHSECQFFGVDTSTGLGAVNRRISMELAKMDYRSIIYEASVYKKMTRHKLLSDHHVTLLQILNKFSRCIEKTAVQGRSTVDVKFFSPLHYTKSASRTTFNVISKKEIRDLIIEMFEEKHFQVEVEEEYSKIKSTNIIGLHDQVINYNDPKFFSFTIRW